MADNYANKAPVTPGRRIWLNALAQYPILSRNKINYAFQPPGVDISGHSETYPAGEEQRPGIFPIDRPGIAVADPRTTPDDIMAEYSSHVLRESDPVVRANYQQFVGSMTPDQKQILQEQYAYARQNSGETRPYETWEEHSGLPAWYRGYLFKQWPSDFVAKHFTPQQQYMLDSIMPYFKAQK